MIKYYNPDNIWETVWKIKSKDEFLKKHFIEGKFHSEVPEEIINEFKTVEYLLACSYFYYPLLDEAFSKCTRIFEIAINLKIKLLNIKVKKNESLNDKIDKVAKFTTESIKDEFHHIRKVRNSFAHPKPNTLYGITLKESFYNIINIFNYIFVNKELFENAESNFRRLHNKIESTLPKGSLLKLNWKGFSYLINEIKLESTDCYSETFTFSAFQVLNKVDSSNLPLPFILNLREINFENQKLKAYEINTKELISFEITNANENLTKQKTYFEEIKKVTEKNIQKFKTIYQYELTKNIPKNIYNSWSGKRNPNNA